MLSANGGERTAKGRETTVEEIAKRHVQVLGDVTGRTHARLIGRVRGGLPVGLAASLPNGRHTGANGLEFVKLG